MTLTHNGQTITLTDDGSIMWHHESGVIDIFPFIEAFDTRNTMIDHIQELEDSQESDTDEDFKYETRHEK